MNNKSKKFKLLKSELYLTLNINKTISFKLYVFKNNICKIENFIGIRVLYSSNYLPLSTETWIKYTYLYSDRTDVSIAYYFTFIIRLRKKGE